MKYMYKSPQNMKELCQYVANKRKNRKAQHLEILKIYGECSSIGDKKYKLPQKSSFSQQHKYTCSKMWRGNNEKFDLKTLKLWNINTHLLTNQWQKKIILY